MAILSDWANMLFQSRHKFLSWRNSLLCIVVELHRVGLQPTGLPRLDINSLHLKLYIPPILHQSIAPFTSLSSTSTLFHSLLTLLPSFYQRPSISPSTLHQIHPPQCPPTSTNSSPTSFLHLPQSHILHTSPHLPLVTAKV